MISVVASSLHGDLYLYEALYLLTYLTLDAALQALNRSKSKASKQIYESTSNQQESHTSRSSRHTPIKVGIIRNWQVQLDNDLNDFCKVLYQLAQAAIPQARPRLRPGRIDPDSGLSRISVLLQERECRLSPAACCLLFLADDIKLRMFVDRLTYVALDSFSNSVKEQVVRVYGYASGERECRAKLPHAVNNHVAHVAAMTAGFQVAAIVSHLLLKFLAPKIGHGH
ncbi:hypothetical protein VTL71DRAFT_1562 [Oculimacula yallundae]|uniref:Uncharacterized protein n=1 Tax=Oculimacula yallundae TaxID=86028 RepID=A0ABR4CB11_9HELO